MRNSTGPQSMWGFVADEWGVHYRHENRSWIHRRIPVGGSQWLCFTNDNKLSVRRIFAFYDHFVLSNQLRRSFTCLKKQINKQVFDTNLKFPTRTQYFLYAQIVGWNVFSLEQLPTIDRKKKWFFEFFLIHEDDAILLWRKKYNYHYLLLIC